MLAIPATHSLLDPSLLFQHMSSSQTHLSVTRKPSSGGVSRSSSTSSAPGDGSSKPKITKSRNGCITCKAKRLKCDETKPTCLQCKKRNVECGGYKKNFKWKSFDESSFNGEGNSKARQTRPSADSRRSPSSPTATSPSDSESPSQFQYSQTLPMTSPTSAPWSSNMSLAVPQRPRGGSTSSQFSYYDPSGGYERLQVPGFINEPSGHVTPVGHGTPGSYTPYCPSPGPNLDPSDLEAMLAQEMHSPIPTGFFPDVSGAPSNTYPYTAPMGMGMNQGPQYIYNEPQMMVPSTLAPEMYARTQQWQMDPSQHMALDEQALQQAMAEIAQQQEELNRSMHGSLMSRSRSYQG